MSCTFCFGRQTGFIVSYDPPQSPAQFPQPENQPGSPIPSPASGPDSKIPLQPRCRHRKPRKCRPIHSHRDSHNNRVSPGPSRRRKNDGSSVRKSSTASVRCGPWDEEITLMEESRNWCRYRARVVFFGAGVLTGWFTHDWYVARFTQPVADPQIVEVPVSEVELGTTMPDIRGMSQIDALTVLSDLRVCDVDRGG